MRVHFAALVVTLACSPHDSAESKGPPEAATRFHDTPSPDSTAPQAQPTDVLATLYQRLVAMGHNRAAFRSRLGEPQLITAEVHPNIQDSTATDTLVQWTYDQLRLRFLVVAGRDLLVETGAAPDNRAIAQLIGQFRTLEAADSSLGAPQSNGILGDTMVYYYGIPEPDGVDLYFVGGRLVLVAAVPYVD